jgi:hypothetical protein
LCLQHIYTSTGAVHATVCCRSLQQRTSAHTSTGWDIVRWHSVNTEFNENRSYECIISIFWVRGRTEACSLPWRDPSSAAFYSWTTVQLQISTLALAQMPRGSCSKITGHWFVALKHATDISSPVLPNLPCIIILFHSTLNNTWNGCSAVKYPTSAKHNRATTVEDCSMFQPTSQNSLLLYNAASTAEVRYRSYMSEWKTIWKRSQPTFKLCPGIRMEGLTK